MTLFMTAWQSLSDEVKASYIAEAGSDEKDKPYSETSDMIKSKELFAIHDVNSDGVLDKNEYPVWYKAFIEHLVSKHGGVGDLPEEKKGEYYDHMNSHTPGEGVSFDDIMKQGLIQKACGDRIAEAA